MGRAGYDDVVVLTGFPSFGARKMCEQILRTEPKALVHAVVRAKFQKDAEAARDELPLEQRRRLNMIEGDAASMDLGLSGKEFLSLAREVDRIHHMAQVTYPGVDRKSAERVNIGGAREVMELAAACKDLKCLVVHSSALVSGDRTGRVREDELYRGQNFRSVVEETKARAEKLLSTARGKFPVIVVRPTTIMGDSESGEVDRLDGPYLLILLIVTSPQDIPLPIPGRADALLHLVPIDYVVRAAHAIGLDSRAVGRTFHIADPSPLTVKRVFELVAAAGGRKVPRGFISANLTAALLRTPGLDRIVQSPRSFIETLAVHVEYDTKNTEEILASTDIRCPPFESYVDKLVEFVQLRVRERRARRASEAPDPLQ